MFVLTLLILLSLAACRREEPQPLPTMAPTAVIPETVEQGGSTDSPTAVPAAETAVPQPRPVSAAAIDWAPRVVYSDPLPGEEVSPDGTIMVWFDQAMDQASVEAAFVLAQTGNGRAIKGEFQWPRPDAFQFTPKSSLQAKQRYQVQIDAQAASANGQKLIEPVQFDIQTTGPLAVNQTIPEDGVNGVQTDAAVTVLFNQPVVPLVSGAQQADLPQPLTFEPPVAGTGEWTSTSIYRFVPDEPLAGATTYQVTVEALTSISGGAMAGPFTWQFTTLSPEVVIVEPEEGGFIAPTETISVTFNMPMDPAVTEAATTLRGVDAPAVSLDYAWSDDGRILGVTPNQPLQMETEYQLRIDPSAASASGEAILGQEYIATYATWPFPAIATVWPEPDSVSDQWTRGVSIDFVSPMDWDTVEDRILIEPDPGVVRYYFNSYINEVSLDFPYELDTEYTITVPGDVADPYGNTLGADFTWRFSSPGRPPIASFNLPPQISQLSTSIANNVDIIQVNSGDIQVQLYDMGLPLNLINRPYDLQDYQPAADPLRSWQVEPDSARNEVGLINLPLADGGTLPTGVYLLAMDAANVDENARYWQNQRNLLVIADTNLTVKEMFGQVHVWVTDIGSGQPAAGRDLTLFDAQGVELATAVSNSDGFASFPYQPPNDYLEGVTVISSSPGETGFGVGNSRWNQNISGWTFDLNTTTSDEAALFAYIYTDRPIYRPGDTIYYKGIVRETDYGRYTIPDPQPLELKLVYNNFSGGQSVDISIPVETDAGGTFAGEYVLPEDAPTGGYELFIQDEDVNGRISLTVAEYRRPEFQVTLMPEKEEALRGEAVDVLLEAVYFFGGSAADLPVDWSIYEEPYSFRLPGLYYSFGDNAQFNYQNSGPFGGFGRSYLTGDRGMTDGNGRLTIPLPSDLLTDVAAGSRRVIVEATVQDVSGFPITSMAQVVFHAAELVVGVTPRDYINPVGRETAVSLITTNWQGDPVPNQSVEVTFYQREWLPVRTNDGGMYYTAWETEDTEVARVQVQTDEDGTAEAAFTPEVGGTYLAVATIQDGGGRTHLSSTDLYVTDSNNPLAWQTDPVQKMMELVPDKPEYVVGETARILVQSPFAGPVKAWLTIERGTLMEQRVITLNSNSDVLEIPITADFAPNVFVSVTAVRGVNANDEDDPFADIRLGITELVVPPEQLALNVQLTPRDEMQAPRETAVFDIQVTDHAGNPVANTDLSLALVDLAVLTLKDDNAVPIVAAFYSRQPYRSQVGAGLFISGEGLPVEIPEEVLGRGGGGGGDFAAEAAAGLPPGGDDDVRRDFPDTAFWEPHVTTDEEGRAVIEIPLPDTLTTWRLSSKGVTSETLVGQAEVDITTTLPLLLRPITPRFFTVGDEASIGTVVHNNTAEDIEATVSLQADGLTLRSPEEQDVTVAAGDKAVVRWQVTADAVDFADLTFRVNGGGFSDATKPSFGVGDDQLIPVMNFTAQDVVATSGELAEDGRRVEAVLLPPGVDPAQGGVEVVLSASLGAAVLDGLAVQNNLDISESCASSVAYQLLPNTAVAHLVQGQGLSEIERSLQPEMDILINQSIARLEELQHSDGGWGWCRASDSKAWVSAYALLGLIKAEQTGYQVDSLVMSGAAAYLEQQLQPAASLTQPDEVNFQAFMLYVLAEGGKDMTRQADALVAEHRALLQPSSQAMLALVYHYQDVTGDNLPALMSDLNNSVVVSATGAHWEVADEDFASLSGDIFETAVVVNALSQIDEKNPNLPPAVRWLMNARTVVIWPGAAQTTWSLMGLTEWLAASGELNANYEYAVLVNLQKMADGRFGQENVAENRNITIPLSGLLLDDMNYVEYQRGAGEGTLYYSMYLNSAVDANQVSALNRGFALERAYYDAACDPDQTVCEPIEEIQTGQRVRVVLTAIVPNDRLYVTLEDPIPAGTTAIDPGLNTTSASLGGSISPAEPSYQWGYWGWWYFDNIEYGDEKVVFQSQFLPAGTYQYSYFLETNIPGRYQVMPAFASEELTPEVNGRSAGSVFTITE